MTPDIIVLLFGSSSLPGCLPAVVLGGHGRAVCSVGLSSFEALAGNSGFSRPDELRVQRERVMEGGKAVLREGGLGVTGDLVFLWLQLCGWWALQRGGMAHLNQAPPASLCNTHTAPPIPQFSPRHHLSTGNDFIWLQLH